MKKKNIEDVGVFNVLLIGENPHAISIADNINSSFRNGLGVNNNMQFNILDDIEDGNSWFNEFIFDVNMTARYNNIVVSSGFKKWNDGMKTEMERIYMKKLLQAMNFVIVDISVSDSGSESKFDEDIPQIRFNEETDFLQDMVSWIDSNMSKIAKKISMIKIVRTLCYGHIPYLGDVFGCLSGKKYSGIITTDKMRFDDPILFDEFCAISRGRGLDEIESSVITRSNSTLSAFFRN